MLYTAPLQSQSLLNSTYSPSLANIPNAHLEFSSPSFINLRRASESNNFVKCLKHKFVIKTYDNKNLLQKHFK